MNPHDYIKKPCHENWNAMTGDEQKKFCDKCSCSVHNLTGMDHQQIMNLRSDLGGKLCGVFQQPCQTETPEPLKKRIHRIHLKRSLVLGASISTLALAACQSESDKIEILGQCETVSAPKSETNPEGSTKPTKPVQPLVPVKPEVLMGGVCPEPEVKPPKVKPPIMGKVAAPPKEIKLPKLEPRVMGIVAAPQKEVKPPKQKPRLMGRIAAPQKEVKPPENTPIIDTTKKPK